MDNDKEGKAGQAGSAPRKAPKAARTVTRQAQQDMHDAIVAGAADIVATGKQHAPIVFIATLAVPPDTDASAMPPGRLYMAGMGMFGEFDCAEGKAAAADVMRRLLASPNVDALVFVSEAWAMSSEDGISREAMDEMTKGDGALQKMPGSYEAIVVNVYTKSEQSQSINRIVRTKDGKPATLERGKLITEDDGLQLAGRFALLTE